MPIVVLSDGLTGSLVALAIRRQHPGRDLLLIEVGEGPGKACFLPFCESAVPEFHRGLIEPLVVRRWNSFYLSMREGAHRIAGTVSLLAPEQIHAELLDRLEPGQYLRPGKIAEVGQRHVILENGRKIDADLLIETRERENPCQMKVGGTDITVRDYWLDQHHGLDVPVLLDASMGSLTHAERFLQYIPLSKNLLRVSSISPRLDGDEQVADKMSHDTTGIRMLSEKRIWTSSQYLIEEGLVNPDANSPLPAYLDGRIISALQNSAWEAVNCL